MMEHVRAAPTVVLPGRLLAPSLTVAGLAGWILAYAGLDTDARRTRDLQDLVDAGLRCGDRDVEVVCAVVEEAVSLWRRAADLTESWAAEARAAGSVGFDGSDGDPGVQERAAEFERMATRLRLRAEALQRLLPEAA